MKKKINNKSFLKDHIFYQASMFKKTIFVYFSNLGFKNHYQTIVKEKSCWLYSIDNSYYLSVHYSSIMNLTRKLIFKKQNKTIQDILLWAVNLI